MKKQKPLSLTIVLLLCVGCFLTPLSSSMYLQAQGASNIVIAGVDIGYSDDDYFTTTGKACSGHNSCMRYWPTGKSNTCEIDLDGSQCCGYARYCQWKVYGYHDFDYESKFNDLTGDITNCTGSVLKSKLINCSPATHLRTMKSKKGYAHSIVIIDTTDYGVNITDANNDGACGVRYDTYSWDQLASWVNQYGGVTYAFSAKEATHTHNFVAFGYEQAHPHKVFKKCECGYWEYTKEEKTLDTCLTCNPTTLKVYFNANGGSISSDTYKLSSGIVYNKSDSSKYYQKWTYNDTKENGLVNNTTFGLTKTGYFFAGWGTKASGGTVFNQNNNSLKPTDLNSNIVNGDCSITLYAQWTKNPVINFEKTSISLVIPSEKSASFKIWIDGSLPEGATPAVTFDSSIVSVQQDGKAFTFTALKEGETTYTFKVLDSKKNVLTQESCKIVVSNEIYSIRYSPNGGTDAPEIPSFKKYGSSVTLNTKIPTREGYTFKNWNTKSDGSGTSYASGATYKANANATLYAQWKANTLTVNYHVNGGSINSDKYKLSSSLLYSTSPGKKLDDLWTYNETHENGLYNPGTFGIYKTGYSFAGWGTKSSGGTVFDQNDATLKPTNINSNIKNGNCSTTLYAQWKANSYKITFNGNGSTGGSMSDLSMTYGTSKNLTANAFSKTGYTFNGWNTKANGTGTAYADKTSVKNLTSTKDGTVALYAQWTKNHTHFYTSKITREPTCTTAGFKTLTCSCGYSFSQTVNAKGHDYVTKVVAPTCTEQGYTKITCSNCSYASSNNFVSATGHTYGEWVVTKQPTTTHTGVKAKNCHCGAAITETLPKLTAPEYFVEFEDDSIDLYYKDIILADISTNADKIIYSSSDTSVAVVNENGKVTAVGTGDATITASVEGTSVSDTCEIRVSYAWWQWIILILLFGFIWY